jgi:hypothetical protein
MAAGWCNGSASANVEGFREFASKTLQSAQCVNYRGTRFLPFASGARGDNRGA